MDYLTSTLQGYQPIFVGAGCLALGYIYGWHCRSMVENNEADDVLTAVDTSCNHVANHVAVEPERIGAIQRPASCLSDSALKCSSREIVQKPERRGKRNVGQLEIFQMPRKKEDSLWFQSRAFKKQKGVPVIKIQRKEPIIQSKAEPEQDSDDEILARRLAYFKNRSASVNKPRGSNHVLKLSKKKKKSTAEVTTTRSKGKNLITMDSQKSLSKTTTRSRSGLRDLANSQGECSLEDTCRSPKTTMYLENSGQVEATNSAHVATVQLPCAQASELKDIVRNPLEGYLGDDSAGLMDSQCELNEPANDSDHTMRENEEEERLGNARMEDDIACEGCDIVLVESSEEKVPTSRPAEFHGTVQDKCLEEVEREVKKDHRVPMDKVLKVEIYELLHAADGAEVSFEEIVSLLEEKLKVVLREDKAHIVSLVREVISISKLLEEEKALEGSEQVEAVRNVSC